MTRYPHPIIAREGWPYLIVVFVVAVALSLAAWWPLAALAWVAFLFILQFFRDPPRNVPGDPNVVLSPADGRIVRIGNARDPWLDRDALLISVFMNVFNVHSNRSPVDADVAQTWYHPATFVNAALDKASIDNERNALKLVTADGRRGHLRADRGADRPTHPLLRQSRRPTGARAALRLHPLRLARRPVPAARRDSARDGRRQGLRDASIVAELRQTAGET